MARRQTICGHEPHHAKGLCRPCHDFFRKQAKTNIAPPGVPEELRVKVEAAGMLVPREDKRFRPLPESPSAAARQLAEEVSPSIKVVKVVQKELPFDTSDPKVASHIAGAVAKSLHDFRAAAKLLRPDLSSAEQATLANQLEQDPYVRAALQEELAKLGLTDDAKKLYISLLWSSATDMRPQAEKDRSNARRLLARAFLPSENPSGKNDTPVPLPISNLEAGLDNMGLGDEVVASVPATQISNSDLDEETREEMEREE
jgi:hypothetical protein